MLSLDERLAMLDDILSEKTPDEILAELQSYPAIGSTVDEFTKDFPMTLQEQIKAAAEQVLAESKTDITALDDFTCCQIANIVDNDELDFEVLNSVYKSLEDLKVPFLDTLGIPTKDKEAARHLSAFLSFLTFGRDELREYRIKWLEFIISNIEGIK